MVPQVPVQAEGLASMAVRFLVRRKDLTATERGVTLEVERVWKHLANPQ